MNEKIVVPRVLGFKMTRMQTLLYHQLLQKTMCLNKTRTMRWSLFVV